MTTLVPTTDRRMIGTKELATLLNTRPQSIYKRLLNTGTYWGLEPTRLPNGRLLWPADAVDRLVAASSRREDAPGHHCGAYCGSLVMGVSA